MRTPGVVNTATLKPASSSSASACRAERMVRAMAPSLMPGGDAEAYRAIRPIFEAIAAKTDSGACVTHVGPDGAGHFVKMVHNGIEYADMQFIAEAYHVLRDLGSLDPLALANVFTEWNRGPLESFLIEITSQIFAVKDPKGRGHLIDQVLDKAGQKGTGRWTAQVALEHGVPIPSIAAAIDARVMSSLKNEREAAERVLTGPAARTYDGDITVLIDRTHDALYAAKIVAYAQGMDLIVELDRQNAWAIDLKEIARIWKGGCIIRARFLDEIMTAYEREPKLPNLFLDAVCARRSSPVRRRGARLSGWPSSRAFPYRAWRQVWPTSTATGRRTCHRTSRRRSGTRLALTPTNARTTR